jgi:hypothetical protein
MSTLMNDRGTSSIPAAFDLIDLIDSNTSVSETDLNENSGTLFKLI